MEHKKNFDEAVKNLEKARTAIVEARDFTELSKREREAVQALMTLETYMFRLDFWIREAKLKRYDELQHPETASARKATPKTEPKTEPKTKTAAKAKSKTKKK